MDWFYMNDHIDRDTAPQSQKAVSAHLKSEQIVHFDFYTVA